MNKEVITTPQDLVWELNKYAKYRQEHFGIVCLDSERKIKSIKVLFIGSEHRCLVDTKMVFWYALSKKASSFILFHNHPSNNPEPSTFDIELTETILKAGEIVGLELLDHLVIARSNYFSFLEHDLVLKKKKNLEVAEKNNFSY